MALGPLSAPPVVTVDTTNMELLVAVRDAICRALSDLGLEEEGRGISLEGAGADAEFTLGDRTIEVRVDVDRRQPELPRAA